jgi:hypothetical protein
VKRRDLERHLREHDCRSVGGTKHEKWRGPTGHASVLPRHTEIAWPWPARSATTCRSRRPPARADPPSPLTRTVAHSKAMPDPPATPAGWSVPQCGGLVKTNFGLGYHADPLQQPRINTILNEGETTNTRAAG